MDFADLIYNGKWFTPLREALSAFADNTQKHVTGSVKLKLYKGNIITSSITSPESLYSEELVTFNESAYDQTNATGFINLWGLPDTVLALRGAGEALSSFRRGAGSLKPPPPPVFGLPCARPKGARVNSPFGRDTPCRT